MYELTVEETYKKRVDSNPILNGIWSRTMRDIEETNEEIRLLIEDHKRRFDVLSISQTHTNNSIIITMEYARKRGFGRLGKTLTVKKKNETRVTRVDDLI